MTCSCLDLVSIQFGSHCDTLRKHDQQEKNTQSHKHKEDVGVYAARMRVLKPRR